MLKVSREGFRKYLKNKAKPWKYEALSKEMIASTPKMSVTILMVVSICFKLLSRENLKESLYLVNVRFIGL